MFHDLAGRRKRTQELIDSELKILKYHGFNPITGKQFEPIETTYEIAPSTHFISALEQALKRITIKTQTRADIKSIIKYLGIAARKLHYDHLSISEVKRKHIKILLEEQGNLKLINEKGKPVERNWSPKRYNVYWKYLHRLFKELIELEACEYNPVAGISKKIVTHTMRETLSKTQRHEIINVYLKGKFYNFYRFCQIFFHSGGRIAELLRIQVKDVDIERQRYKTIVEKGKARREEERTIKDKALPFWEELIKGASQTDYIFSRDLKPGPVMTRAAAQITRRWRIHVKDKFGITADIYSLKHSNLDEVAAILDDAKAAQEQAGHTTPVITIARYLHGENERKHQRLKGVDNEL